MEYMVHTPCGALQGVAGKRGGTVAYKGIRYATAGRWEYPTKVTHWDGVYDATRYGACGYQRRAFIDEEQVHKKYFYYREFRKGETYTYSEDCLFLNVFTPAGAKEGDKLPVLIYIHGGSFTGGCGHEKHFDEPVWPEKGVIGVTINYRLGPWGFVCLPELKEEAGYTGNYGLFDQLTAIEWVKENIAAFGGDPDTITIMGQSAGAMSVQQHALSPLSRGLFSGAVMCSGGGASRVLVAAPAEKNYAFWQKAMENAGCKSLAEFRAIEPEALYDAWNKTQKEFHNPGCFPCIDGRLVVGTSMGILSRGEQHHIHYMAGATSEDMLPLILQDMSRKWCEAQPLESYTWHFDRQLPGDDCGAWHSADLWYWFGTLDNCWRPMEEKDYALSAQMVDYLCDFVKTGDPNAGGKHPTWLPSTKRQKQALILGEAPTHMAKPSSWKLLKTTLSNKPVGE